MVKETTSEFAQRLESYSEENEDIFDFMHYLDKIRTELDRLKELIWYHKTAGWWNNYKPKPKWFTNIEYFLISF